MAKVDPRLNRFVARMRRKLARPENQAKSDWRELTDMALLRNLHCELGEMILELDDGPPEAIADEAADAANILMMIADKATAAEAARVPRSRPEGT